MHTFIVNFTDLEGVLARVESPDWEAVTEGFRQLEVGPIGTLEAVLHGVELEGAGKGQGHGHLGAGHEAVGGGVGVITAWKF